MPSFTVRVQLVDVESSDSAYETLHGGMEGRGFTRTIRSDDGITYEMPFGTYNYVGDTTRSDVLDRAKRAASATKLQARILVTEANGRTWSNLERA